VAGLLLRLQPGCEALEDLKRAAAQHERPSSFGGKLQISVTPPRPPDREEAAARYAAPGIDRLIALPRSALTTGIGWLRPVLPAGKYGDV